MKKTLAILLAAVMLLAMSAVAMAATPTGNITVNNLEQWSKVELYQLIEMPFDDANNQYNDVKWTDEMATWLAGSSYSTLKPTDAPSWTMMPLNCIRICMLPSRMVQQLSRL